MDKSTLSNYGWIVIVTLVLSVMFSIATPLGDYVGAAVVSTLKSYSKANDNALKDSNIDNLEDEWAEKFDGEEYDGEWEEIESLPPVEAITRPDPTLPSTEPTTEEPAVIVPSVDPKNNVLTIYYLVKPTENLASGFTNKSGLINTVGSNGTTSVYKQTVKYGQKLSGGLTDPSYFGLTNTETPTFVGWKISDAPDTQVLSETTEYKPEELTSAIKLGDREIYLEAVWSSQVTIKFNISQVYAVYNYQYSKGSNNLLQYIPTGKTEKVDYVMTINKDNTFTLPDGTSHSQIVLPDGEDELKLYYDMDYEFGYWTINGKEIKNSDLTYEKLLIMNNGDPNIIIEPYFEQVWF